MDFKGGNWKWVLNSSGLVLWQGSLVLQREIATGKSPSSSWCFVSTKFSEFFFDTKLSFSPHLTKDLSPKNGEEDIKIMRLAGVRIK